jgi:hypothetical protein
MTSIAERLAGANPNPANSQQVRKEGRGRVPMSVPEQKLSVPEIAGYHLHWMRGASDRIAQAQRAGYTFVSRGEVGLNTVGLADGQDSDGNSDLGDRVSHISGVSEEGTQAQRLYLMKLPLELWEEDQKAIQSKNEDIAAVLRGDKGIQRAGEDNSNRYVPKDAGNKNLFQPKNRRA